MHRIKDYYKISRVEKTGTCHYLKDQLALIYKQCDLTYVFIKHIFSFKLKLSNVKQMIVYKTVERVLQSCLQEDENGRRFGRVYNSLRTLIFDPVNCWRGLQDQDLSWSAPTIAQGQSRTCQLHPYTLEN